MKKAIFSGLISLLFFTFSAREIFACSCVLNEAPPAEQVKKAYKEATAVFSGKVVEVVRDPDVFFVKVKLRVEKSWKNKFTDEVTITTASNSAACGFNFEVGEKYLLYTRGERDNLQTDICQRTSLLSKNGDIKFLDKIKKKRKTKSSPK